MGPFVSDDLLPETGRLEVKHFFFTFGHNRMTIGMLTMSTDLDGTKS